MQTTATPPFMAIHGGEDVSETQFAGLFDPPTCTPPQKAFRGGVQNFRGDPICELKRPANR